MRREKCPLLDTVLWVTGWVEDKITDAEAVKEQRNQGTRSIIYINNKILGKNTVLFLTVTFSLDPRPTKLLTVSRENKNQRSRHQEALPGHVQGPLSSQERNHLQQQEWPLLLEEVFTPRTSSGFFFPPQGLFLPRLPLLDPFPLLPDQAQEVTQSQVSDFSSSSTGMCNHIQSHSSKGSDVMALDFLYSSSLFWPNAFQHLVSQFLHF